VRTSGQRGTREAELENKSRNSKEIGDSRDQETGFGLARTEAIDFMLKKLDKWRQPAMERDRVRQRGLVRLNKLRLTGMTVRKKTAMKAD